MGIVLRQASSGAILEGESDGDVLVWDAAAGEWNAGAVPAELPDGTYPGEPLAWDGSTWIASPIIAVQGISPSDAFAGVSVDASAGALVLTGAGSSVSLAGTGPQMVALAGTTLSLQVDGVPRLAADGVGLAFFGVAPVARPSITGVTAQEQIDSLVSALAVLGLVTDDR